MKIKKNHKGQKKVMVWYLDYQALFHGDPAPWETVIDILG